MASGRIGCPMIEITIAPTMTAKAPEWLAWRTRYGLKMHPRRNPAKWPNARKPISAEVKPRAYPEKASKGRSEPIPIWINRVESKSADREMSRLVVTL